MDSLAFPLQYASYQNSQVPASVEHYCMEETCNILDWTSVVLSHVALQPSWVIWGNKFVNESTV